jgi:hypothetical protein
LFKVTTKDNHNSTKGFFIASNILKSAINTFMNVMMLHWGFIPDDEISDIKKICKFIIFGNWTHRILMDFERKSANEQQFLMMSHREQFFPCCGNDNRE